MNKFLALLLIATLPILGCSKATPKPDSQANDSSEKDGVAEPRNTSEDGEKPNPAKKESPEPVSVSQPVAANLNEQKAERAKEVVDLLRLVDPKKNAIKGTWLFDKDALSMGTEGKTGLHLLEIPHETPEEFTLVIELQRTEGNDALFVIVPIDGHHTLILIDAEQGTLSGIHGLDNKGILANESLVKGSLLKNRRLANVEFTVRKNSLSVSLDGKQIINFDGKMSRLTPFHEPETYGTPNKKHVVIGTFQSKYLISKLQIVPGTTAVPPPAVPKTDPKDASPQTATKLQPTIIEAKKLSPEQQKEAAFAGRYVLTCNGGSTPWLFTDDHKALENGKEMGQWKVDGDTVVITYHNEEFGLATIDLKGGEKLVGKNVWRKGAVFNWVLERVPGQETAKSGNSQVIAEGVGATADEALKDAFRNAVRQVVGAVVDAETLVKNDAIISDKVLTYSDGFVKTYEEISKKQDQGFFQTKIKATVERRSVIAKLKAANITVREVDGKGIFAEVVTQLDAEKNAKQLLTNALEGFPMNVLEAEVVGKPEVVKRDEAKVTLKITVRFTVNQKAFETFAEKLRPVLESVAKEKNDVTLMFKQIPGQRAWSLQGATDNDKGLIERKGDFVALVLNTQRTTNLDRQEWKCYVLDKSCLGPLENCNHALAAKVSLMGDDGKIIAVDSFPAIADQGKNYVPPAHYRVLPIRRGLQGYDDVDKRKAPSFVRMEAYTFWLSPFFLKRGSVELKGLSEMTCHRTIILTLAEVKAIQNVKCELTRK